MKRVPTVVSAPDLLSRWAPTAPIQRALALGAGGGEEALWLAQEGFQVDAVEKDRERAAALATACAGLPVSVWAVDALDYAIQLDHYGLVVALAMLHFISPAALADLADRIVRGLVPGGLLVAQVLTEDDPSLDARRASGDPEICPNTCRLENREGLIHYFSDGELRTVFGGMQVLEDETYRFADDIREAGFGAGEDLVARRPAESRA